MAETTTERLLEIGIMATSLIDTHTHLDAEEFGDDLDDVIAASRANGITRWINVGFSTTRWESTVALAARFDGLSYMLGVHPGHADEWSDETARQLNARVRSTGPVAIGEIGLDLYWRQDNLPSQITALEQQLDLATSMQLPTVLHMREADEELLRILNGRTTLPHLHFHSFDGNDRLRRWVLERQSTIGVGGLMSRKGSEALRSWIADFPRERVVLETDSPYLKPQGIRGTRNQPAHLTRVADILAELWGATRADVDTITTANACRIFNMDYEG